MRVALVFVLIVGVVSARTCTKVNGISGACGLHLNYFTLAGTHNSASGAFGQLYWWSGGAVPSCFYRNQDLSITDQLAQGIRYFDFDIAHINHSQADGDWWEEGIVLVHCGASDCAYTRSLRRAMSEIENFLGSHRDEVVVVRMKDHPEESRAYIRDNLARELSRFITGSGKVKLSRTDNPVLGEAIERNERLIVTVNGGFNPRRPIHSLRQVESYKMEGGTDACFSVNEMVHRLTSDPRAKYDYYPLQVDWYHAFGLCLWDLAGLCDGTELHKLIEINREVVKVTRRPINLVMIDYAGRGDVKLADVVAQINRYNVNMFT